MTETELGLVLKCIDEALKVYDASKSKPKASDISVKSMLTVLRTQVADQLRAARASSGEWDARGFVPGPN